MMDLPRLKTALSGLQTLPTLPFVQQRLADVLDDPRSSLSTIGAIVRADPVITARLLQTVNMSRDPRVERVLTVTKAVRLLGLQIVHELVEKQAGSLGTVSARSFEEMRQLWVHSLATAVAAQAVARAAGYPEPEECYVAGLLHDMGKLALHYLFPERFATMQERARLTRRTFYRCEVDSGELSHAKIGRLVGEEWSLPLAILEVAGWHHTPQLSGTNRKLVAAAHVGDILARALDLGWGGDRFVPPLQAVAQQALDLRPADMRAVLGEVEIETARLVGLFA